MSLMGYLLNNANHFGSFGSDLPLPVIEQVVADEHDGSGVTPAELVTQAPQILNDAAEVLSDSGFVGGYGNNPVSKPYRPSASSFSGSPVKKAEVDFINAELAKHYGMSKSTAYQEALSNTAYQRAMKDMQAAGLNPSVMFGSGRAQSASASIYAAEERSGGGGYSRRRSGGSSSNGKLFSGSAYAAIQAIGGLVGIATTKRPDGFWVGSQTAKGAMGLLDAIWKK